MAYGRLGLGFLYCSYISASNGFSILICIGMKPDWFAIWFGVFCFLLGAVSALVPTQKAKGKGRVGIRLERFNTWRSYDFYRPTPFAVMYEIKRAGIKQPQIAFNQVRLETGFDTCSLGFRTNNLWCFATNKHLRFENWRESVYWYKCWQIRTGYDTGDYYTHLRKYWGADDMNEYIPNLKRFR